MENFYYKSLYRQDSPEELPVMPMEEKDDIFDDDSRSQQYPVGSTLGTTPPGMPCPPCPTTSGPASATPSSTQHGGTTVAGAATSAPSSTTGAIGTQGTTVPSVSLPATCAGCEVPSDSILYTQGYLKTQIGRRVRVQFLLGTNSFQDRTGILEEVGISYIILRNEETNTKELCDLYSIKFVDFF